MTTTYDVGDLVRVTATFTNLEGTASDPEGVSVRVRQPDGTVTTLVYGTDNAVVRDNTGVYHVDIDATTAGTWSYRFAGTGTGRGAAESTFFVQRTRF